jgi:hypothetical protein
MAPATKQMKKQNSERDKCILLASELPYGENSETEHVWVI